MANILLTGYSGFIGSNILDYFSKNNTFYIIVRNNSKKILSSKKVKIIKFKTFKSLNNELKKIKINTVIHCATHYVKNHKFNDLKNLNNANILLGNVILENLKTMKVKRFINFSTVWEDSDGKINNSENLYAAYKKSFSLIINFYKKVTPKVDFFELMIVDTFGKNDRREKIINKLKKNYQKKRVTKIISKNLYLNLLNISDILEALKIIIKKKVTSKKYVLKNSYYIKMQNLIETFNKKNKNKIKVKWLSNILIKKRIYPYDKLKGWKPKDSDIGNIINHIKN